MAPSRPVIKRLLSSAPKRLLTPHFATTYFFFCWTPYPRPVETRRTGTDSGTGSMRRYTPTSSLISRARSNNNHTHAPTRTHTPPPPPPSYFAPLARHDASFYFPVFYSISLRGLLSTRCPRLFVSIPPPPPLPAPKRCKDLRARGSQEFRVLHGDCLTSDQIRLGPHSRTLVLISQVR